MPQRRRVRAGIRSELFEEEMVIPRPRRAPGTASNGIETVKPRRRRSLSGNRGDFEAGRELLDIFLSKNGLTDSCQSSLLGSSPPARAGNPLVRDIRFVQNCSASFSLASNHGPCQAFASSCSSSVNVSPSVRVEGFFSPSKHVAAQYA